MKITALIENDSFREGICAQYGLSLYVQTRSGAFVVDAGQDDGALNNFFALGFSAEAIDAIVISHNHFDHIGGMQGFVDATAADGAPVYVSAGANRQLYTKTLFTRKQLCSRNDLIRQNAQRIRFVDDRVCILPDVYVCTVDAPDEEFVCKDRKLRMAGEDGRLQRDDFRHEVYVAVIEAGKLTVISSCSHNGIVNILRDARKRFDLPVSEFVGGLHLRGKRSGTLNCSRAYVKKLLAQPEMQEVGRIHTCHCTGKKGYALLKQHFPEKVRQFSAGDSFEL